MQMLQTGVSVSFASVSPLINTHEPQPFHLVASNGFLGLTWGKDPDLGFLEYPGVAGLGSFRKVFNFSLSEGLTTPNLPTLTDGLMRSLYCPGL